MKCLRIRARKADPPVKNSPGKVEKIYFSSQVFSFDFLSHSFSPRATEGADSKERRQCLNRRLESS